MNFGKINEGLRLGKMARRKGWNGKGMYIFSFYTSALKLKEDDDFSEERYDVSELQGVIEIGVDGENTFPLENFVLLKTAGNTCIPWNVSQADMLADDWEYVLKCGVCGNEFAEGTMVYDDTCDKCAKKEVPEKAKE